MSFVVWLVIGLIAGSFAGLAIKAQGMLTVGYLVAGAAVTLLSSLFASWLLGSDVLTGVSPAMVMQVLVSALGLVVLLRLFPDRSRI